MRWLADRLRRSRWIAVPVLAYLLITLVLPAAHGATARPDFTHHAATVLVACVTVVALVVALELVRRRPS